MLQQYYNKMLMITITLPLFYPFPTDSTTRVSGAEFCSASA